ncbi:MAG: RNA-binding protein [Rhizobiales bacterium]|nr:RNA-binding protein [Hyphomicrobiales bacterium]
MLATAHNSGQGGELDRGAISVAAGTERACALTREPKPVSEMIRFVLGPAGEVVADVKRKLPGRGIWITASRTAIEEAVKRHVFARGFKREVRVAGDLAAQVERLLHRAALDALAIAAKAGAVPSGFAKVEAALGRDDILALIHACDGSAEGKRKLDAASHRNNDVKPREIAVIDTFTGGQLDLALNRPNVVHAALLAGPGAATFLARVMRLERFRTGNSPYAVSAHAPTDGARGKSSE